MIKQLVGTPYAKQRIKVYVCPGITETCWQPGNCSRGFGRPDDLEECYKCSSKDICKRVGNKGLRWEYV